MLAIYPVKFAGFNGIPLAGNSKRGNSFLVLVFLFGSVWCLTEILSPFIDQLHLNFLHICTNNRCTCICIYFSKRCSNRFPYNFFK